MSNDDTGETEESKDEPEQEEESQLGGHDTFFWQSDDCPPEVLAQFRSSVAAYEQAPLTTHFQQLEEDGVELPAPESVDDRRLTAKLWEVIEDLARMRVFLSQTDHLSDRELYILLWHELLRESVKDMLLDEASAWHLDILGSGSREDTYLYLKYYADEDWRQRWLADFPADEMPEHEEPPYDRDRYLPTTIAGSLIEPEDEKPM